VRAVVELVGRVPATLCDAQAVFQRHALGDRAEPPDSNFDRPDLNEQRDRSPSVMLHPDLAAVRRSRRALSDEPAVRSGRSLN
jgi:hypothetical protein